MTLIRWTPTRSANDLLPLRTEFDHLIDSFFTSDLKPVGKSIAPAVDVEENADAFVFRADLPGLGQKDVKVSLNGETLTIRGERKRETDEKKSNVHRVERAYGTFERSFTLPSPVRAEQVEASYRDGVLEVKVPKAEQAKVREIEVQVG